MGLHIGMSSCSTHTVYVQDPRNPNPKNFRIRDLVEVGRYLVAKVEYPGCTNFEGVKILVFRDVRAPQLRAMSELDPHFCQDSSHPHLVARFRPDAQGWADALAFATLGR